MPLKIYGVVRSRASRNIWICKELGIPYEIVPVIQAYRLADPTAPSAPLHTRRHEFLAINPNGHVPSIDDDGFVLHELLAISLYLVKKHGGPLAPRDLHEDALMVMWALWAVTECETHTLAIMISQRSAPPDKAQYDKAAAALNGPLSVLEKALEPNSYLVGGRFTVADASLVEVLRYAQAVPRVFEGFPRVQGWMAACQARPAYQAMVADRAKETE